MLIDLRSKNIDGKSAEHALEVADITVNKNMVPFDDKSPFITSGIRVGTAAVTTRGLDENDMVKIVNFIDEAIINHDNEDRLKEIANAVNLMMNKFPLFST
jgi:glycine hydroxymethyltransferase